MTSLKDPESHLCVCQRELQEEEEVNKIRQATPLQTRNQRCWLLVPASSLDLLWVLPRTQSLCVCCHKYKRSTLPRRCERKKRLHKKALSSPFGAFPYLSATLIKHTVLSQMRFPKLLWMKSLLKILKDHSITKSLLHVYNDDNNNCPSYPDFLTIHEIGSTLLFSFYR